MNLITDTGEEIESKWIDKKKFDTFLSKIDKEEDIKKISEDIASIANISEEIKSELVNRINIDTFLSKIDKENNIGKIGFSLFHIAYVSEKLESKLAKGMNIENLLSKINKEDSIYKIFQCVSMTTYASKELAYKLLDNILTIEDIEKIATCIVTIRHASYDIELKLIDHVDIDALSLKIDKEKDIMKIGRCISYITVGSKLHEVMKDIPYTPYSSSDKAYYEMGKKLTDSIDIFDSLQYKIENEEDIEKIGTCIMGFAIIIKEYGWFLIQHIGINNFLLKINKEKSMVKVDYLIRVISKIDKKTGNELIKLLDPDNLKIKIKAEPDNQIVIFFFINIYCQNKKATKKLVNVLDFSMINEFFNCPCCGYRTLSSRGYCDICQLCEWEDDEMCSNPDEITGGPNQDYSLTEARNNFKKYYTMYRPDTSAFDRTSYKRNSKGDIILNKIECKKILINELERLMNLSDIKKQNELFLDFYCRLHSYLVHPSN